MLLDIAYLCYQLYVPFCKQQLSMANKHLTKQLANEKKYCMIFLIAFDQKQGYLKLDFFFHVQMIWHISTISYLLKTYILHVLRVLHCTATNMQWEIVIDLQPRCLLTHQITANKTCQAVIICLSTSLAAIVNSLEPEKTDRAAEIRSYPHIPGQRFVSLLCRWCANSQHNMLDCPAVDRICQASWIFKGSSNVIANLGIYYSQVHSLLRLLATSTLC